MRKTSPLKADELIQRRQKQQQQQQKEQQKQEMNPGVITISTS